MGRPKKFNREEVLEKAMPLFWKHGFASTGLQDLEKATGVNKSGLYSEFKDKEDLFLESLRHYFAKREGRDILLREPLGWENIEAFLKFPVMPCSNGQKGCFAVNSMPEAGQLSIEAEKLLSNSRAVMKRNILKNLQAVGKENAEALVDIISTFFSGLCIETNLKQAKAPALRKVEDFIRALREM